MQRAVGDELGGLSSLRPGEYLPPDDAVVVEPVLADPVEPRRVDVDRDCGLALVVGDTVDVAGAALACVAGAADATPGARFRTRADPPARRPPRRRGRRPRCSGRGSRCPGRASRRGPRRPCGRPRRRARSAAARRRRGRAAPTDPLPARDAGATSSSSAGEEDSVVRNEIVERGESRERKRARRSSDEMVLHGISAALRDVRHRPESARLSVEQAAEARRTRVTPSW